MFSLFRYVYLVKNVKISLSLYIHMYLHTYVLQNFNRIYKNPYVDWIKETVFAIY